MNPPILPPSSQETPVSNKKIKLDMGSTKASNLIALTALVVAALALASANFSQISGWLSPKKLQIEIGESAFPQERLCSPSFPVSFTLRHVSGAEVSLRRISLTIKRPDGKTLSYQANTYQTLGGEQPFLSGLRLKPGDTWANSILFTPKLEEGLIKERNELQYKIEDSRVQVAAKSQAVAIKNKTYPFSPVYTMPLPRATLLGDPNASDWDWTSGIPTLIDSETKKLVSDFCEKNLREFQRGKHVFNFEIVSSEGVIVANKTFDVTVYESDIDRIRKLNDVKYVTTDDSFNKPQKEFYTARPLLFIEK